MSFHNRRAWPCALELREGRTWPKAMQLVGGGIGTHIQQSSGKLTQVQKPGGRKPGT